MRARDGAGQRPDLACARAWLQSPALGNRKKETVERSVCVVNSPSSKGRSVLQRG